MKKIIAGIIAITTVLCAFTGCGKRGAEDGRADNPSETTTIQETTAAETTEAAAEMAGYSSYEELVKDFVEAYAANDRKKTLYMQYPDNVMDIVKVTMKGEEDDEFAITGDISEEEAISSLQYELYKSYSEDEKATFNGIISAEALKESESDAIKHNWGVMTGLESYIKEHGGPDKINRFELDEIESDLMGDDLSDSCEIEEGYHVTFEIKDENTGETSEGMMNVFRIKGESWKVNVLDSSGYVIRDRSDLVRADVSSVDRALNTALVMMDESNNTVSSIEKPFIAGSDEDLCFNVPDSFDTARFIKEASNFVIEIPKIKWFAVIYNGLVVYCAVDNADGTGYAGTYPPDVVLNGIGENGSADYAENPEQKSLEELYDICAGVIGE